MRKLLFDTNIVVDVLLNRQPFVAASSKVWETAETGLVEGLLSAHAVTTIHYLLSKELGGVRAKKIITAVMKVFGVAAVDGPVISEALQLGLPDFEDAVTAAAARRADCLFIVTRDTKGFRGSPVTAITPETAIGLALPFQQ